MILILVPLAGCSGTDTEVSVDLSNEDINELIDENLEDVMNNTTVVVFQEYNNNTSIANHNNAYHNDTYHNNTTVVMQPSTTKVMSGTLAGIESIDDMPAVAAVVREDRYTSGGNLNGATICVGIGTELESDFQDWFNDGNIDFTSVPVSDQAEATQKLRDGECDAMATTMYEAQAISESINSDETIDLATWVASPGSHDGPPYSVRNSVTFQIHQASDELISRPFYDFTMIELHLICTEGATNCENVTLTASSYNDVNIEQQRDDSNTVLSLAVKTSVGDSQKIIFKSIFDHIFEISSFEYKKKSIQYILDLHMNLYTYTKNGTVTSYLDHVKKAMNSSKKDVELSRCFISVRNQFWKCDLCLGWSCKYYSVSDYPLKPNCNCQIHICKGCWKEWYGRQPKDKKNICTHCKCRFDGPEEVAFKVFDVTQLQNSKHILK